MIEHIGTTLRRTRREREDSQEQVAALLGVGQPTYSRIERGKLYPPRPSYPAVARYLSTPGSKLTTADVRKLIDVHILERREAELAAELEQVRGQLAAHASGASAA